ncbi:diphthamide biosynthesis protein [Pyrolobus fumarii 1A]|uniref:2-(3-amino-3-carboxypropyl)histidine synthase n=1 Tax=Pyrolobus fumarii (strain DSM 11204 / 1A) TaxID=694429 RepID=G0EET2_PYRF1|nr:2-(3-amino-3-carboxypropyl)histidine synthase subunit 1/2 [Pyrolobus fumarii]AEM38046.1 diphthamide biosynthesis protein [Pyrolobus fumarii 1A]
MKKLDWAAIIEREILNICESVKGKKVFVELPEGFKIYTSLIRKLLLSCGARQVAFRLEPTYGSCESMTCELHHAIFDVVLHVGHDAYPYEPLKECNGVEIIYVPVKLNVEDVDTKKLVRLIIDTLSEDGVDTIAIGYNTQYEKIALHVVNEVNMHGFKVLRTSPILGCFFGGLDKLENVDAYLVFGSRFHALGLGLATHASSRIYVVDVDKYSVNDYTSDAERVLRVRYGKAMEARNARKWGIIVGARKGQCRLWLVERLASLFTSRGLEYTLLYSSRTLRQDLDAIPVDVAEAFVVTSCPRLAIEDLSDYWRPVLTPGEALYALGVYDRVKFPW